MGKYSRVSPESDPWIQGYYRKVISVSEQEKSLVWHFINTNSKTFMWTCEQCVMLSILTRATLRGFLYPLSCPSTVTDHTISCYPFTHIIQWTSICSFSCHAACKEEDTVESSNPSFDISQELGHIQIIRLIFRYFLMNRTRSNHMTRLSIFLTRIMTHSNHLNHILIFLNE